MKLTLPLFFLATLANDFGDGFTVAPGGAGVRCQRPMTNGLFSANNDAVGDFDQGAFERKNASRQKFGLKPITPEEFQQLEAQIQQMSQQQAAATTATIVKETTRRTRKNDGFLKNIFGNVVKDTCESNYDCERPQECCDFGFVKKCCSSGKRVTNDPYANMALIPVPVDMREYGPGYSQR